MRKLVMLLKQDYNFNLESKSTLIQIKKYTILCREDASGSTVESILLVKICEFAAKIGKKATSSSEGGNLGCLLCIDLCPSKT